MMMFTKFSINNNNNNVVSVLIFLVAIMLIADARDETLRPGSWCIATPSASNEFMEGELISMCNGSSCPMIEPSGECYLPNTLYNHVSVINNRHYTPNGAEGSCYGLVILTNPSYGSCNYPRAEGAPPSLPGIGRKFESLRGVTRRKQFCVPKPGASEEELIANIEYACSQLGDCITIDANGACFLPDNTLFHASVVMNMYFASKNRVDSSCDFNNTGVITITDPSYRSCIFD